MPSSGHLSSVPYLGCCKNLLYVEKGDCTVYTVQYNCTTITKNGYTMCRTNEIFDMENIIFGRLCPAVCALWTMQNSIPGPLP